MSQLIFCDFETQSATPITNPEYIQHETTDVVTFQYIVGNKFHLWINKRQLDRWPLSAIQHAKRVFNTVEISDSPKLKFSTSWLVAHNAEVFDQQVSRRFFADNQPLGWVDTIHLCRLHGVPASLKNACLALGIEEKQDSNAMLEIASLRIRKGKVTAVALPDETWIQFVDYCKQDVASLKALYERLASFYVPPIEQEILETHKHVNERGFKVDTKRAYALLKKWQEIEANAVAQLEALTKGKLTGRDIHSPAKLKNYLASIGATVTSLTDDNDNLPEAAKRVLELRETAVGASSGKIRRFLEAMDSYSVVRRQFVYCGAHTGRWTGRETQPQNFKRVEEIKPLEDCKTANDLSQLTKSIIVPHDKKLKFSIHDYSAIEARGVAWLAGETKLLDEFAAGKDVYVSFAKVLFQRDEINKQQRFIGKSTVLGCGYQMGYARFVAMMGKFGVDFASIGLSPKYCVDTYRNTYSRIPELWKEANAKFIRAIQKPGYCFTIGDKVEVIYDDEHLQCSLPSGRVLRYWGANVRKEFPKAFESDKPIDQIFYRSPKGWEESLYGGKIVENIVQAICRDILADRLHALRDCAVLHVHDEITCEVASEKEHKKIGKILVDLPEWANGFPLAVNGEFSPCYR